MKQKILLKTPTEDQLIAAAHQLAPAANEAIMILLGEHSELSLNAVHATLNTTDYEYFGGIFPGIIFDQEQFEVGIILLKLPVLAAPFLITNKDWEGVDLPDMPAFERRRSMITLVDGLMAEIGYYLEMINNRLGDRFSFIGAGAGSLSLQQKPCLLTREGVFQDAVVCCFIDQRIRLGIRHGYQRLAGPFVVTEAEGNTIKKINWKAAFSVYQEVVAKEAGQELTTENFFSIAKGYPFGMTREHEEDIVRDPILANEKGELVCVGEVPNNSVLYILKGENEALIEAARQAYQDCHESPIDDQNGHFLVVDCISRTLFLEEKFQSELAVLQTGDSKPVGVLSLGEIASYGLGSLEFFNKTIVLGQFKVQS